MSSGAASPIGRSACPSGRWGCWRAWRVTIRCFHPALGVTVGKLLVVARGVIDFVPLPALVVAGLAVGSGVVGSVPVVGHVLA